MPVQYSLLKSDADTFPEDESKQVQQNVDSPGRRLFAFTGLPRWYIRAEHSGKYMYLTSGT